MLAMIKPNDRDRLFSVIQKSLSIRRHIDFFLWLQQEVRHFLPHDVLIAAWGDFRKRRIAYDIASSLPEIRTQKVIEGSSLDPVIASLYERWIAYGQQAFALRNLNFFRAIGEEETLPHIGKLASMKSIFVQGIRDMRSKQDCLYVFLEQNAAVHLDQSVLNLLLPHVDAALRRVECLVPLDNSTTSAALPSSRSDISSREDEILSWVGLGKTNEEIGLILNISPNTVKNHLKKIFQKLDVSTRAQAIAKYQALEQETS